MNWNPGKVPKLEESRLSDQKKVVRLYFIAPSLVLLAACTFGWAYSQQHSKKHLSKAQIEKAHRLKSKLEQVHEKKIVLRHQLAKTNQSAHVAHLSLNIADGKLDEASSQLEDTLSLLKRERRTQKKLSKNLAANQKELLKDRKQVQVRIRANYEEGTLPIASVFLGSVSSGDLASQGYFIKRIATEDSRTLTKYESQQKLIISQKQQNDQLITSIKAQEASLALKEQALETARNQKYYALNDIVSKRDHLEQALEAFDRSEAEIENEIQIAEHIPGQTPSIPFNGHFIRPVIGPITSPFGMRYHPILHRTRMHTGIDIGVPYGTSIHVAASGKVVAAQYMGGYGNVVIVDHGGGIATVYAHCSRLLVSVGEHVNQGQVIAKVGATGLATGPHLHFEVRVNGHPVNPERYVHL